MSAALIRAMPIGPRDPISGLVIGGNKSLLVNAEYMINVGGPGPDPSPARLLVRAGQPDAPPP